MLSRGPAPKTSTASAAMFLNGREDILVGRDHLAPLLAGSHAGGDQVAARLGTAQGYLSLNVGAALKLPPRRVTLAERILNEHDAGKMYEASLLVDPGGDCGRPSAARWPPERCGVACIQPSTWISAHWAQASARSCRLDGSCSSTPRMLWMRL
jgi:hypothetical protein